MSNLSLNQRKNWFRKINKNNNISRLGNLISTLDLFNDIEKLQKDVVNILFDSLKGKKKKITLENFLKDKKSELNKIQLTDGSIIKIFYDNFLSYMKLHQTLLQIFKKNNLIDHISGFSLINLRLVKKVLNPTRPYATTKLHIDIFANEPSDIVHFWVPLSKNDLQKEFELNEGPEKLNANWFKTYKRYDEFNFPNLKTADISKTYNKSLIFDGICPHRTILNRSSQFRVSMDVKLRRSPLKKNESYSSNYNDVEKFKKLIIC